MFFILILLTFSLSFPEVIARVNGKVITKEEFDRAFDAYWKGILHFSPGKPREEDKRRFLLEYLKGMILEDVAREMGITVNEGEVEKKLRSWGVMKPSDLVMELVRREITIEKIEEKVTKDVKVSEHEVEAYYLLNKGEFRYPDQVKLLRIVAHDREKAEQVYRSLRDGRSVPRMGGIIVGGERWYSIHALPRKVKKMLRPYNVGAVSRPLRFEAGYLILKVTDRRKAGLLPLSEVRERVKRKILRMKREEVFRKWFREVLKGYRLEIYLKEL